MTMRTGGVLLLVVGLTGLAPIALADTLPIPPIPPMIGPSDEAAPVPNPDLRAPVTIAAQETRLTFEVYRMRYFDPSRGFVPGSQYQTSEERNALQTPGFSVRVPLR